MAAALSRVPAVPLSVAGLARPLASSKKEWEREREQLPAAAAGPKLSRAMSGGDTGTRPGTRPGLDPRGLAPNTGLGPVLGAPGTSRRAGARWPLVCQNRRSEAAPRGAWARRAGETGAPIKNCFLSSSEQVSFGPGRYRSCGPSPAQDIGGIRGARPVAKGGVSARSKHGTRGVTVDNAASLPILKMAATASPNGDVLALPSCPPIGCQRARWRQGSFRPGRKCFPRWQRTRSGERPPPRCRQESVGCRSRGGQRRGAVGWRRAARRSSCCEPASRPWCGRRC